MGFVLCRDRSSSGIMRCRLVRVFVTCGHNVMKHFTAAMEQRTLKNVNSCRNTNIYSYLETSGDKSSNLYLNVVHFFDTSVN